MRKMNTLVVYFSKFGNTQKAAEVIAEELASVGSVRLISWEQLPAAGMEDAALVVMGSPTHRMNLPEAVRPLFDRLPKGILQDTAVAAFDTSYKMSALLAHFTADIVAGLLAFAGNMDDFL
jgi:flavodoxin